MRLPISRPTTIDELHKRIASAEVAVLSSLANSISDQHVTDQRMRRLNYVTSVVLAIYGVYVSMTAWPIALAINAVFAIGMAWSAWPSYKHRRDQKKLREEDCYLTTTTEPPDHLRN